MFEEFPKIARLNREAVITEKIDGINTQIFILAKREEGYADRLNLPVLAENDDAWMFAGSRTQFLTPEKDNHGFAKWVQAHATELWALGHGRHFGEWWGCGIRRGYGLQQSEKRFSLFNVGRWVESWRDGHVHWDSYSGPGRSRKPLGDKQQYAPECCHVVPTLWHGTFNTEVVGTQIEWLRVFGSVAAPGFPRPEGVIIFHTAASQLFKVTLEKDDVPKTSINT